MIKFEKVSRFANEDIVMPTRKTLYSAGYDMVAAEDIIIPSYIDHNFNLITATDGKTEEFTLDEMAALTKSAKAKPTLVSTGMKCQLNPDTYLQLSIRSSSPLKYWLILANGVGIVDADYYNNPDNEGEIFFQVINLSPVPIKIQKGEIIGQAIIIPYNITNDDAAIGERIGGFGSTTK